MLLIAGSSTRKVVGMLTGGSGVAGALEALATQQGVRLPGFAGQQIVAQNVTPEVSDLSTTSKYPQIYVYCTKVNNLLREKFRSFSGDAEMSIEVRVSQDRLDQIESNLQGYVDAVTEVLDGSRGDWGDGFFYDGGYEVSFGGVKHGGKNFMQIGRIAFVLEISAG